MIWVLPTIIAFLISIFKEIFKKKLLVKIEPIQFIVVFYTMMFVFAQTTLTKVSIPSFFQFFLIICSASCYCFSNLLGLKVLKSIRISIFKPISGLSSVFVILLAITFLGETLDLIKVFGILLVLLPILYLSVLEYLHHNLDKKNILYLVLAMVFEAGAIILDRINLKTLNTFTYFYFLKLVLVIMFLIIMYKFYNSRLDLKFVKKNFAGISSLALITMIGAYAYFFALKDPSANTGVIKTILSSSLVFTTLFGGVYFKEKHIYLKVVVASLSLIGIILLMLNG